MFTGCVDFVHVLNKGNVNQVVLNDNYLHRRRNWSVTTFQHYIGYSSHYIHIVIVYTGEIKETQKSDTGRPGISPQPPCFLYVPGVQLRYTEPTFYVPIQRTKLGKSCRCLRTHRTQCSGWNFNSLPQVVKSVPLPLSYRGSSLFRSNMVNNLRLIWLVDLAADPC